VVKTRVAFATHLVTVTAVNLT